VFGRRNKRPRNACLRLRAAVEAMPRSSREAMLRGIAANTIIVGAYTDRDSGGICPMLAAHRNGGRTDLASFARSWDRYTDATDPRPATKREIRTLVALLESSLTDDVSLAEVEPSRRTLPPPLTPPERPGLGFRIRRLRRSHLSRASARPRRSAPSGT
jgi:hypothetical protein